MIFYILGGLACFAAWVATSRAALSQFLQPQETEYRCHGERKEEEHWEYPELESEKDGKFRNEMRRKRREAERYLEYNVRMGGGGHCNSFHKAGCWRPDIVGKKRDRELIMQAMARGFLFPIMPFTLALDCLIKLISGVTPLSTTELEEKQKKLKVETAKAQLKYDAAMKVVEEYQSAAILELNQSVLDTQQQAAKLRETIENLPSTNRRNLVDQLVTQQSTN